MNVETDQAFLSLLSSQRELLNRLNQEATSSKITQDSSKRKKDQSPRESRPIHSQINRSIAERRTSLDIVTSKRFSIGFGCDHDSFTLGDSKSGLLPTTWKDDDLDYSCSKRSKADAFEEFDMKSRKKRRMSSLGFLNLDIFDHDLNVEQPLPIAADENEPAESEAFDGGKIETADESPVNVKSDSTESKSESETSDDDEEESEGDDDDDEETTTGDDGFLSPSEFKPIKVDPAKMWETMNAFHKSMEMSQYSQQAIHDWDRKMGLKRSHSKTMRLSTRSRKKLKAIMKKEISLMKVDC